jgi:hypothetical protein
VATRLFGDGWMPILDREDDGRLILGFPVDSGHVSFSVEFEVTEPEGEVVQTDPHRLALLFGVVFTDAQRRHTSRTLPVPDEVLRTYARVLLLGGQNAASSLLDAAAKTDPSLRHMVRLLSSKEVDVSSSWFPVTQP